MLNLSNISNALKRASLNQAVKLALIAALFVMAGSFFYRLVIFPYQNQKALGACVLKAKGNYDQQWTTVCLSLFDAQLIQEYGEDKLCASMAAEYADPIEQNYERQIDDCLDRYPDKAGE